MSERHARLLARLGEKGVELACEAFERAMAADDPTGEAPPDRGAIHGTADRFRSG